MQAYGSNPTCTILGNVWLHFSLFWCSGQAFETSQTPRKPYLFCHLWRLRDGEPKECQEKLHKLVSVIQFYKTSREHMVNTRRNETKSRSFAFIHIPLCNDIKHLITLETVLTSGDHAFVIFHVRCVVRRRIRWGFQFLIQWHRQVCLHLGIAFAPSITARWYKSRSATPFQILEIICAHEWCVLRTIIGRRGF